MTTAPTNTGSTRARIRPLQLQLGPAARAELENHRDTLSARMEKLKDELLVVEQQYQSVVNIIGVGTHVPTQVLSPITDEPSQHQKNTDEPSQHHKNIAKYRHINPDALPKKMQEAILVLEAAGVHGITAREFAEVAQFPIGTASGRLAVLSKLGRAVNISPRYYLKGHEPTSGAESEPITGAQAAFVASREAVVNTVKRAMVVHSTQEDNNPGAANHG